MFEKLLSVIPYNPGLLGQMSFYSRRMRQEASVRRTGMIFIVLAFMIQFFAVLAPPKPTVADSVNDLINGGISSADDAKAHCLNPQNYGGEHFGSIIHYFGMTCKDVGNAETVTITKNQSIVTDSGERKYLYSMGEINYTTTNDTLYTDIPNHEKLYARRLSQVAVSDSFRALKLKNSEGRTYFIIYDCGNIASYGLPTPPATQTPAVAEEITPPAAVPPPPPAETPPPPPPPALPPPTTPAVECTALTADITTGTESFTSRLTATYAANQADLVNGITFDFGDGVVLRHNGVIIDHVYSNNGTTPVTYNAHVTINTTLGDRTSPACAVTITVQPKNTPPTCPSNPALPVDSPDCYCKVPGKTTLPKNSPECFIPCEYNGTLHADDAKCKPCDKSVSSADALACISIHKAASNITAGIADANNTTAKAGDVITYTLYAKNEGKATIKNFSFQENISDVLDYADPTDLHGGVMDDNKNVKWPSQDIKSGETATKQVTVTVKNPIPQTSISSSDPQHFDLSMTNIYGNVVTIKLPAAPAKTVEVAAAKLPNTGPGTTIFVTSSIVMISGYFYGRARLLARESDLAVEENSGM